MSAHVFVAICARTLGQRYHDNEGNKTQNIIDDCQPSHCSCKGVGGVLADVAVGVVDACGGHEARGPRDRVISVKANILPTIRHHKACM